jgi:hypothetical protein
MPPPAAPAPPPSPTLAEFLEGFIVDELLDFQSAGGTRKIRETIFDLLKPQESEIFVLLGQASARMNDVQSKLQEERQAGRIYSWVFPSAAAAAFEGIFHACAGVWLLAGDPPDASTLKSSVRSFIHLQVKGFVTAVGA